MADSQAKKDWDAQNTLLITAKLNRRTDSDIVEALERSQGSRASRIKELIRKGLDSEKQEIPEDSGLLRFFAERGSFS